VLIFYRAYIFYQYANILIIDLFSLYVYSQGEYIYIGYQ